MSILDVTAFAVVAFRWQVYTFLACALLAVFIGVEVMPQRRTIKKISFITKILVGQFYFFKTSSCMFP